jgi:hypothetical protein
MNDPLFDNNEETYTSEKEHEVATIQQQMQREQEYMIMEATLGDAMAGQEPLEEVAR